MTLSFVNPATGSAYRLRSDPDTWRIIKSRTVAGSIVVRNLAGIDGDGDVDPSLLDLLVRGEKSIPRSVGNAQRAFAATVLLDIDRTYNLVVALAREAEIRCRQGCPGFRAQSPPLRKEAAAARNTAMQACAAMAESWKEAGLVAATALPEWLIAGLDG